MDMLYKLTSLLNRPVENEIVEFKEAKQDHSFDRLGKYFSALSNEANLKGVQSGWLVFGVRDDNAVVGTAYRPQPKALESLKKRNC